MKKEKRFIIWSNDDLNIDDWQDFLEEAYPEIEDEFDKWQIIYNENDYYLDDERANLNVILLNEIVVLGSIGRWNGTAKGYKVIKSGNIADCLNDSDCDYATWYCDSYNFKFEGHHHDGTNRYLYRVFKEGVTEEQKERFYDAIYYGKCNDRMISRYTESIRPYIAYVYGWSGKKKKIVWTAGTKSGRVA